jgi:hypothetical protein
LLCPLGKTWKRSLIWLTAVLLLRMRYTYRAMYWAGCVLGYLEIK